MPTFYTFMLLYSVAAGFGMGLIWFLPIGCGWSYFPKKRPLVAGSMFSWIAVGSIIWHLLAHEILNSEN